MRDGALLQAQTCAKRKELNLIKQTYAVLVLAVCVYAVHSEERLKIGGIEIVEYGIYRAKKVTSVEDKNVVGGSRDAIENFILVSQTNKIPATIGTRFGFRYVIKGEPKGAVITLKMVGKYPAPGLKSPGDKRPHYYDQYSLRVAVGDSFTSYSFDEEWELVTGDWTFEIWYEGRKLAEKIFTVYKPTR